MKALVLLFIVFISVIGTYIGIPPIPLITLYAILLLFPLIFFVLRKNLLNGLLLWFIFTLFARLWWWNLPLIPDMPPQRIMWVCIFFVFFLDVGIGRRKLTIGKEEIVMLLFCAYALFSGIVAGSVYIKGQGLVLSTLLNYFIPFSFYFLARNIVDDEQKARKVFVFFTIIGLYLGITAIFEHFRLDYLVFPSYIMNRGIGIHWGQARGPFVQAGLNGLSMAFFFYMAYYLFACSYGKKGRFLFGCAVIFILIGILLTYSRGTWISLLASSLLVPIFFPSSRKVFVTGYLAIGVVALTLLYSIRVSGVSNEQEKSGYLQEQADIADAVKQRFTSKDSVYSRINVQTATWRMINDNPIWGYGFNTFKKISPKYFQKIKGIPYNIREGIATHNAFLLVWAEEGLIGLTLFILIIGYTLIISFKLYRLLPMEGFFGKGLAVISGAVFVMFTVSMMGREIQAAIFPNAVCFFLGGILSGLHQRLKSATPILRNVTS
ncbi:MAG: O-antigen ligase family protein [Nitrospirae bacterium]|nr:O-antigen ligase family protein [Nitrospirota bacterium]